MIIAIDFDGVIHDAERPVKGRRMGAPIAGARETIEKLRWRLGAKIIVFTARAGEKETNAVRDWLNFYEIDHDEITNIKPIADIYLDDKAVRFTTWAEFASTVGVE